MHFKHFLKIQKSFYFKINLCYNNIKMNNKKNNYEEINLSNQNTKNNKKNENEINLSENKTSQPNKPTSISQPPSNSNPQEKPETKNIQPKTISNPINQKEKSQPQPIPTPQKKPETQIQKKPETPISQTPSNPNPSQTSQTQHPQEKPKEPENNQIINQKKPETKNISPPKPISNPIPQQKPNQNGPLPQKKTKEPEIKFDQKEREAAMKASEIYRNTMASIKDLIAPSSFDIKYDKVRVGGMYAQSFFTYAYPRFLETGWITPIVNFDTTIDISMIIKPINSQEIMKTLRKKVAQMQSSMRMNQKKGMVRDPELETALQDAEVLRDQLQRGEEKFFHFGLYFTIYDEDEKQLKHIAKQLENILGGRLIMTKRVDLRPERGFNSSLPLMDDELEIHKSMNTSPLSTSFPFTSSELTSNEGILYGVNRHNESLIIFDRFSLENANSVIFAKSGAGKSYFVKLEIIRYMMFDTDVIIIDPENEYEALSDTVGGTYLKISLNANQRINPFDLPLSIEGNEELPGDLLRSNIITLSGLIKIMIGTITTQEDAILEKAILDTYKIKGITMETENPGKIDPPTMEDLHAVLSDMDGAESLTTRIEKFTHGTFAGIFNKETNIDLKTGLIVFCIRDLEDELRPIAMYIILNYIWTKVRSKLKRRMLVVDEAWNIMQHEDSAKFLFGLVKRARKYYLGISTITQDVEDFITSKYGRPVITNSSMQVLLKQAPSAIEHLTKVFNLTEGEKYLLLNSDVGQGLFFAGAKHVAIQIIASYKENKIITTNPQEILQKKSESEDFEAK